MPVIITSQWLWEPVEPDKIGFLRSLSLDSILQLEPLKDIKEVNRNKKLITISFICNRENTTFPGDVAFPEEINSQRHTQSNLSVLFRKPGAAETSLFRRTNERSGRQGINTADWMRE